MTNSEKVLLEKLNQIIEDTFDKPSYSTDNIYRDLGVSRSQLYRIIKEEFQLSTSLYIRHRKLLKAKELLEDDNLKIAEISYLSGIDSPQNFSKYFTQEFGISPTEFRKKIIQKNANICTQTIDGEEISKSFVKERSKSYYIGFSIVFLSILSVFFYQKKTKFKENESNISNNIPENSIAILPFKKLGNQTHDIFSDGIMEQIHASISRLENIKVISKTSSNLFENTIKPTPQIASELKVNYLMQGSVLVIENKLRISLELIHAKDDRTVWSKKFDGNAKDIFNFMSTVAKEVAGELGRKLNKGQIKKLESIPTKNLEAFNEYLQGYQLVISRDKEKMEAGLLKFDNAIKLDSNFAAAYSNKASTYFLLVDNRFIDVQYGYKMGEKNALTAIRIDSENSLAYAVLANIYRDQNKWEQADNTYQIALKYGPNDALINYWYSLMLRSLGRMEEAIKYSSKAIELDPLYHVILGGHIVNCALGNKLALAEKSIKDGELLFNDSWIYYWTVGFYYMVKNDYNTALKFMDKAIRLNPKAKIILNQIIYCKGKLGQIAEVNQYLKTLAIIPENYGSLAIAYAGVHDKEKCIYYLQKRADLGIIPTDIKVMPYYSFLHDDSRFKAILRKFELGSIEF